MIFFNEVLFTCYCWVRYFHKRKKQYFRFSLDFSFVIFLCKRCLVGQNKWRGTLLTIFRPPPPGYSNARPPAYYVLHTFSNPLLIRIPLPPSPSLFWTLEYKRMGNKQCETKECKFNQNLQLLNARFSWKMAHYFF